MKKLFKTTLLLVIVFIFGACSESTLDEPQTPEATVTLDPKIKRVLALANAEMDRLCPPESRADIRIPDMNALHSIAEVTSRGEEDTLIYVVNYADNEGFALVSARDSEDPVLAIVPSGNYNPETGSDNPGFNMFVEAAKGHVKAAPAIEITPIPDEPIYIIVDGEFQKTESSVETHWSSNGARMGDTFHWEQSKLYGKYCSNSLTGCGPLAMAGIITYLRYRELLTDRIAYTFPGRDIAFEDFEWIQIYKHKQTNGVHPNTKEGYSAVCWEKDKEGVHNKIGRLCRQLGYEANADYQDGYTGIIPDRPVNILKKYMPEFHVSNLLDFTSYATMRCIDYGLLYMRGNVVGSKDSGHAWICDGYDYQKITYTTYRSPVPHPLTSPIEYHWRVYSNSVTEISKNHIVWGWAGLDDGWYSGSVFEAKDKGESFTSFQYISVTKGLF